MPSTDSAIVAVELPLCGIFIGGAARRMGGYPKGLLPAPDSDEPLVARLHRLASAAGLACVLVGTAPAYAPLGLPMLADAPPGIGPLGGLLALLQAAGPRPALALACDLPYLSQALLQRLATTSAPDADVLAVRRDAGAPWEPLLARYQPAALPAARAAARAGERSLQSVLRRLRVQALPLSPAEHADLTDWDQPPDVPADRRPTSPRRQT